MIEPLSEMKKRDDRALPDDVPMGFPMLPPEVVQFLNAPEVMALATMVQLSTPVVAIALAAKRWLHREATDSDAQNRDAGSPVAEIVERPTGVVVRYRGRDVYLPRHAADKIFDLYKSAFEPPEGPDTP